MFIKINIFNGPICWVIYSGSNQKLFVYAIARLPLLNSLKYTSIPNTSSSTNSQMHTIPFHGNLNGVSNRVIAQFVPALSLPLQTSLTLATHSHRTAKAWHLHARPVSSGAQPRASFVTRRHANEVSAPTLVTEWRPKTEPMFFPSNLAPDRRHDMQIGGTTFLCATDLFNTFPIDVSFALIWRTTFCERVLLFPVTYETGAPERGRRTVMWTASEGRVYAN